MWQKLIEVAVRDFFDSWIRDDIKSQFYIDQKINVLRVDLTYKDSVVSRSDIPLSVILQAMTDFKHKTDVDAPTKGQFIKILYDMQQHYGKLTWESPVRGEQAVRLYNKFQRTVEFTTESDAGRKLELGYYDFYVTQEEFETFNHVS